MLNVQLQDQILFSWAKQSGSPLALSQSRDHHQKDNPVPVELVIYWAFFFFPCGPSLMEGSLNTDGFVCHEISFGMWISGKKIWKKDKDLLPLNYQEQMILFI